METALAVILLGGAMYGVPLILPYLVILRMPHFILALTVAAGWALWAGYQIYGFLEYEAKPGLKDTGAFDGLDRLLLELSLIGVVAGLLTRVLRNRNRSIAPRWMAATMIAGFLLASLFSWPYAYAVTILLKTMPH
jgi:hypothetical protein